jgi:hypothetical protein
VLRIRDVCTGSDFFHPGSELSPSRIPIKEFKYFSPSKSMIRVVHPIPDPQHWSNFINMQARLLSTLRGRPICVSGDGQYDSPGFMAAYLFCRCRFYFLHVRFDFC